MAAHAARRHGEEHRVGARRSPGGCVRRTDHRDHRRLQHAEAVLVVALLDRAVGDAEPANFVGVGRHERVLVRATVVDVEAGGEEVARSRPGGPIVSVCQSTADDAVASVGEHQVVEPVVAVHQRGAPVSTSAPRPVSAADSAERRRRRRRARLVALAEHLGRALGDRPRNSPRSPVIGDRKSPWSNRVAVVPHRRVQAREVAHRVGRLFDAAPVDLHPGRAGARSSRSRTNEQLSSLISACQHRGVRICTRSRNTV